MTCDLHTTTNLNNEHGPRVTTTRMRMYVGMSRTAHPQKCMVFVLNCILLLLTTPIPKNECLCSSSGFRPSSTCYHHHTNLDCPLAITTMPPILKTSTDLLLLQLPSLNPNWHPLAATTKFPNSENEPSRSFSGFWLSLGCNHVPNPENSTNACSWGSNLLWPPLGT